MCFTGAGLDHAMCSVAGGEPAWRKNGKGGGGQRPRSPQPEQHGQWWRAGN